MIKLTLKTQAGPDDIKTYNYEFDQPVVTLGRLRENDIQLPHSTVSGFHAQILKDGDNYYLVDRGSINGTFLNNQRLLAGEKKLLQDGDRIRIQTFELYFTSAVATTPVDHGTTIQLARRMVMELLGSQESQQEPRMIVMGGPNNGKQIELTEGKSILVGRGNQCDIVIDHPTISRKHAEISFTWNGAFVKDLGSANGVYCNDSRIDEIYRLRDRDEIRLGQPNRKDPVRLVFSNPAEALLEKIEEKQITDSKPGAVETKNITAEQEIPGLPESVAAPLAAEVSTTGGAGEEISSESVPVPMAHPQPAPIEVLETTQPIAAKKGMSGMTLALLISALVLTAMIVAIGLLNYAGRDSVYEQKANPEKGTSGDIVTVSGEDFNAGAVKTAMILESVAPIVERGQNKIQLEIPSFPNLTSGTQQAEITLKDEKGPIAKAPFVLIISPEIQRMDPVSGLSGSPVNLETNAGDQYVDVYFGSQKVPIVSRSRGRLTVNVPVFAEKVPQNGVKTAVTLALQDIRSKQGKEFLILPGLRIQALIPSAANPGAEVRLQVDEVPSGVAVYFGDTEAPIQSTGTNEIVVTVPPSADPIPEGGKTIPVELRVENVPVAPKIDFTLLPSSIESFQLSFTARPYATGLGLNEYSVNTNIGPFLVVVAKDEHGSSKARAEVIARNLNDRIPLFRQNLSAKIVLEKVKGVYSIFADSEMLKQRELLLRVFPDDALAYSKMTQRPMKVDALADWWKMLIDSYFRVFVQIQSPPTIGTGSAGGSILQQIYNSYSLKTAEGMKYYKKDLLQTLPDDHRNKLIAFSLNPPKKITSVDGKWSGRISNILYSDISDPDLELVLTLQQGEAGSVSGTAEVNWKVGMGRNEGGFENVVYKKIGVFPVSGMFRRSKSFPLEFSFVEKNSRRLNFAGKVEGEGLIGSFEISTTGKKGTWNVRLRN